MNKKNASAEFPEDDPFGIYATVYFANLTAQILYGWFKKFADLLVENDRRSLQDREYVAFTVWRGINSGDYKIVQGIFDNKNTKIYDARVIQADSVDTKIKQAHSNRKKELVFWQ